MRCGTIVAAMSSLLASMMASAPITADAVELVREEGGHIYPVPVAVPEELSNPWPAAEEARFMAKAAHLIETRGNGPMGGGGSTINEREKELYPTSMF